MIPAKNPPERPRPADACVFKLGTEFNRYQKRNEHGLEAKQTPRFSHLVPANRPSSVGRYHYLMNCQDAFAPFGRGKNVFRRNTLFLNTDLRAGDHETMT